MKLAFKPMLGVVAGISLVISSANVLAFRTDHGLLPEGSSSCDAHVPVTLEIPDNAKPVPDPFRGEYSGGFFHVEEINEGLFYMTDGAYQAMFLVSTNGIILVDAPPSIGVNPTDPSQSVSLLDVIYSVPATQGKPIKKLIYSHSALDHIGAAGSIKQRFPNVKIIAHRATKRKIEQSSGQLIPFLQGSSVLPPPLPDVVFRSTTRVRLGGQTLHLSYRGPIHSPGNIFIYAPFQKVLMMVDVFFPGWAPFNDLALADDVPLYIQAHKIALKFDFETLVGGHVNRLGSRSDIETALTYLEDVRANATSALFDPSLFAIFGIIPQHALGAFNVYLDQVACSCANLTLDNAATPSGLDWRQQIGAADINTVGHCWQMAKALRSDPSF